MTSTATFAVMALALALISKSVIDVFVDTPTCPPHPSTIGWVQALHAQTKSDRCFCADDNVRVLPSESGSYAAEIIEFSPLDPKSIINVTVYGKVYPINPIISVTLRLAGGGPRVLNMTKDASACVQVCHAQSPAQSRTLSVINQNWASDFLQYVKVTYLEYFF